MFLYTDNAFDVFVDMPIEKFARYLRRNWTAHMTGQRLSFFRDACQAWENRFGHSPTIGEVVASCNLLADPLDIHQTESADFES